jgi:hypothetical protein
LQRSKPLLTNLSDLSRSVVLQINGPGIEDVSNPSVFNLSGSSLVFLPGVFLLTHGPISIENGALTQTSASSVDICQLLAGS